MTQGAFEDAAAQRDRLMSDYLSTLPAEVRGDFSSALAVDDRPPLAVLRRVIDGLKRNTPPDPADG